MFLLYTKTAGDFVRFLDFSPRARVSLTRDSLTRDSFTCVSLAHDSLARVFFFVRRLVARASTLRENAEESVVGMKRDTDVEAG